MRGCSSTISAVSRPISSGVVTVTLVSQVPKPCTVLVVKSTTPNVGSKRKLVNIPVETITHSVRDRKSTRLNSSHVKISYAVFCLKKKKKNKKYIKNTNINDNDTK